jgi:hypothetical protein
MAGVGNTGLPERACRGAGDHPLRLYFLTSQYRQEWRHYSHQYAQVKNLLKLVERIANVQFWTFWSEKLVGGLTNYLKNVPLIFIKMRAFGFG